MITGTSEGEERRSESSRPTQAEEMELRRSCSISSQWKDSPMRVESGESEWDEAMRRGRGGKVIICWRNEQQRRIGSKRGLSLFSRSKQESMKVRIEMKRDMESEDTLSTRYSVTLNNRESKEEAGRCEIFAM